MVFISKLYFAVNIYCYSELLGDIMHFLCFVYFVKMQLHNFSESSIYSETKCLGNFCDSFIEMTDHTKTTPISKK